ncbi:MAG: hypothetical protein ACE5I1_07455 [bacterium]
MKRNLSYLLIAICLYLYILTPPAHGQDSAEKIMKGVFSSFSLPLRDLMKKEHGSEWRNIFTGFSGGFAFDYPLKQTASFASEGIGDQGSRANTNITLSAGIKYNPLSYWYVAVTFYKYLRHDLQAPWNPDFSYVFGYDDWHPYTFSLTYANYGGNRLFPDRANGEQRTNFKGGSISLGWKFVLPANLERLFTIHSSGGIGGNLGLNLTPEYMDLASLQVKKWKQTFSLGIKYGIYQWWYWNFTVYYYPHPEQQQPWDPDFTFGVGYFDWHPGAISIQYNNYAGNRYPWHDRKFALLENGSITISWSWML